MKHLIIIGLVILGSQILNGCSPIFVAGAVAGAGATVVADRRAPDKLIEDQAIEIQATDFIYSNKDFGKQVHISITSFNGSVLLTGEALSKESKEIIVNKISRMRGVKKVIDVIDVKELASTADRSNDTWITSKVKSNIIAKKGLLTRSKVITSSSDVYLMGIVSNDEAKEIVKIASGVGGVENVIPLFESDDGTLEESLSAAAHIEPMKTEKTKPKPPIEDEDTFTIQPYVLQPTVRKNNDE